MSLKNLSVTEPVRLYVYSVVAAVVALLVAFGVLDSNVVPVILAVVTAVLAVPAVEKARASVSPVLKDAEDSVDANPTPSG